MCSQPLAARPLSPPAPARSPLPARSETALWSSSPAQCALGQLLPNHLSPLVLHSRAPCGLHVSPLEEDPAEMKGLREEDRGQPRVQGTEGPEEMAAAWERPRVSALSLLVRYGHTGPRSSSAALFLFIWDQNDWNVWRSVRQAAWPTSVTPKFLFPLPLHGQISMTSPHTALNSTFTDSGEEPLL